MKKKRKILFFLALNSMTAAFSAGTDQSKVKYEKLQNNIIKNIESKKSNEKNYKLIEDVLNKRNKELKELYLQSDYIVKPEYLEWQVFLSGFYRESNRGKESNEKLSNSGKDNTKYVDLGIVSIPIKKINKNLLELNIRTPEVPNVNPEYSIITPPSISYLGSISIPEFNSPAVQVITIPTIALYDLGSFKTNDTPNQDSTWIDPLGSTAPLAQINLNNTGEGTLNSVSVSPAATEVASGVKGTMNVAVNAGTYDLDIKNANAVGVVNSNHALIENPNGYNSVTGVSYSGLTQNAVMKLVGGHNVYISNMNINYEGVGNPITVNSSGQQIYPPKMLFHIDSHNDFEDISYVYNPAVFYIDNTVKTNINGLNLLFFGIQYHGVTNTTGDSGLVNSGEIIENIPVGTPSSANVGNIIYSTINDSSLNNNNGGGNRNLFFTNDGKITINGQASILGLINLKSNRYNGVSYGAHFTNTSNGEINIIGDRAIGLYLTSEIKGDPVIDLENPIYLKGNDQKGIIINNVYDLSLSKIKLDIGTTDGTATSGIVGMYFRYLRYGLNTGTSGGPRPGYMVLQNYELNTGEDTSESTLIRVDAGRIDVRKTNSGIKLNGENNFGIIGSAVSIGGGENGQIDLKNDIISVGDGNIPIFAERGGVIKLLKDTDALETTGRNITTTGISSHALMVLPGLGSNLSQIIGTDVDSIITNGDGSIVAYNEKGTVNISGTATDNAKYKSLGDGSVVLYNLGGTTTFNNKADYEIGTNGTLLYVKGGTININSNNGISNFVVGENSMFSTVDKTVGGKVNFTSTNKGDFKLILKKDAAGFMFDSGGVNMTDAGLKAYLNTYYTGLDNLNVNLEKGSNLFIIKNYGMMKLSEVINIGTSGEIFNSVSGNGKNAFLWNGSLELDKAGTQGQSGIINLDDENDNYYKLGKLNSSIKVDSDVTIEGTGSGQTALADKSEAVTNQTLVMNNEGSIKLSGENSIGIYTDNGTIQNKGSLEVTGSQSAAIFAENNTNVSNTGSIKIGNNGVGIYGVSYQDPLNAQSYGNGSINITNSGTITSNTGEKSVGIYINNNKTSPAVSSLDLKTGTIDLSTSSSAVGIYADNTKIVGGGSISVGDNGVGLYVKNSKVELSNITVNLNGNNGLAFYLDGATDFSTSGINNININGRDNTLFVMTDNAIFSQNFNITSALGSSYVVGNIISSSFTYDNATAELDLNGTLIYGKDSNITIGVNAYIKSKAGATNVVGAVADKGSIINNGKIDLGNESAGLYGENGANIVNNLGTINVQDNSIALYSDGDLLSGTINNGIINIGSSSVGIYQKNGSSITNTGTVNGIEVNAIGLYSQDNNSNINNSGIISLLGDKSLGIYINGSGRQNIYNSGEINIGDSSDINNPSVGIYSINNNIENSGKISSGTNSVGVYIKEGSFTQTGGSIKIGENGTGIYSDGGTVNILNGSMDLNSQNSVGVFAKNNSNIESNGTLNIGNNSFGYTLFSGSALKNNSKTVINGNGVLVYADNGNIINNGDIDLVNSGNIAFYAVNGGSVYNKGNIENISGIGNIGIYNKGMYENGVLASSGSIKNDGKISVNDSLIIDAVETEKNIYSVGIFGEGSKIENTSDIKVGKDAIGIYSKDETAVNKGTISSDLSGATGLFGENATVRNESTGSITLNGDNSYGIIANNKSTAVNNGVITLTGNNSVGIYANLVSKVINNGILNLNGNNGVGILLSQGSVLENSTNGIINLNGQNNVEISRGSEGYTPPSIINSGVIKVDEKFILDGINLIIAVDPNTVRPATPEEILLGGYSPEDIKAGFLVSNKVKVFAPSFDISTPVIIDPLFSQGTNSLVYKFEDVFSPSNVTSEDNKVGVSSGSLTFEATPVVNDKGNIDIWMEKIPYDNFTKGLWYEEFGKALDKNYFNPNILGGNTGDALVIYDKLDLIKDEQTFRNIMSDLAGNVYANINQREDDIAKTFEDSLSILQDSKNNTKENVRINIIAGKGEKNNKTTGIIDYDYDTTGVLALREVERTYKNTFGYSLGYLHTNFEMDDNNSSEESVDTIQIGGHNKYSSNNWVLKNDLTARASIHNVDRNLNWGEEISKMNGTYETYSITSDNKLGKEIISGKNGNITPYAGIRTMYVFRPTFEESGTERLEVESNDTWSVKPKVGVEFKAVSNESKNGWRLKGALDISYEYELANLNEQESARLIAIEDGYHKLGEVEKDKGQLRTKATLGVEIENRYGIFLTGEYGVGNNDDDDYRAGVTLKAVF